MIPRISPHSNRISYFNFLFNITVLAAKNPEADFKGPTFVTEPINKIDFSNSTGAEIECRASGNPPPEIIWVRSDGTAVGNVPGLRQVMANGNLVFPPFRAEDYRQDVHAQAYACLAKNQVGSIISRDVNVRAGKLGSSPTEEAIALFSDSEIADRDPFGYEFTLDKVVFSRARFYS